MASLIEFANISDKPACQICTLSPKIKAEVKAGLDSGLTRTMVARWLVAEGHSQRAANTVSIQLRTHVTNGHSW